MTDTRVVGLPMRGVIVGTLVLCLGVALAPWLTGGQEPVAMLLSGFALLLGAVLVWRQPEARRLKRGPLVWSFAVLVGFAVLSLLWSANRYSTVLWLEMWVMAGLGFRLAYTIAGEPKGREWVIRLYLLTAGVFCAVALGMYVTGSYDRLTGTFYWPNPAAAYVLPGIFISLDRLRRAGGKRVFGWAGLTVFLLGSFFLTDSRAAVLVWAVVTALYLLVTKMSKEDWIKIVFSVVVGFGLSAGVAQVSNIVAHHSAKVAPGSRLAEVAAGSSQSFSDRFYYLGSAFQMWFTHPVGGTGAGTYGDVHPQYQQRVVSASSDAHNLYIQTLAELGLVGAVALAGVLLWLGVGSLRGLAANPELLPVALGGLALVLHFGLDIDASYPALLMLAGAWFGLVYRQGGRPVAASWRWPALAAVLLVPLVSLYQAQVFAGRAAAAQDDGEYATAADWYGRAQDQAVFNPDVVSAQGIDLYTVALAGGTGAKAAAAQALDRAREAEKLDPHDGQHHQLEGRVLAVEGNLTGAQAAFQAALKLDPLNHPEYALDLASAQAAGGNTAEALATARTMLALYPPAVVANRSVDATVGPNLANLEALVGNILLVRGDESGAKTAAAKALVLDPGNLRGRALLHEVETRGR